jgi:hypothetical protein
LDRPQAMNEATYDVGIVGGGAAGLSAALVLGRARRRVVVVDSGAPRNAPAAHMHGFVSRDGMPPHELLERVAKRRPPTASSCSRAPSSRSSPASQSVLQEAGRCRRDGSWSPRARRTNCRRFRESGSVGDATSFIAPTATAGRCAISRSVSSAPAPALSSTRTSFASGHTTSSSSRTPIPSPRPSERCSNRAGSALSTARFGGSSSKQIACAVWRSATVEWSSEQLSSSARTSGLALPVFWSASAVRSTTLASSSSTASAERVSPASGLRGTSRIRARRSSQRQAKARPPRHLHQR